MEHNNLVQSIEYGHFHSVRDTLIANPEVVHSRLGDGQTVLHLAVANGQYQLTAWLGEKFPFLVSLQDKSGRAPLHELGQTLFADGKGYLAHRLAVMLLNMGGSLEQRDGTGKTPFLSLANRVNDHDGWRDVLSLMLEHGVDPNQTDKHGSTFLHLLAHDADCGGPVKVWEQMIYSSADIHQRDNEGQTVLDIIRKTQPRDFEEEFYAIKRLVEEQG